MPIFMHNVHVLLLKIWRDRIKWWKNRTKSGGNFEQRLCSRLNS